MENRHLLVFTPVNHPNSRVRQMGFELSDPYVEQCWGPVIGPSATLLLRRMPALWAERVPAVIADEELSRSLGLGGGTGANGRLNRSIDRIVRCGLATRDAAGRSLDVHLQVAELTPVQLGRLPEWTRRTHDRLVDVHIEHLAGRAETRPDHTGLEARLDRLQEPRPTAPEPLTPTRTVAR